MYGTLRDDLVGTLAEVREAGLYKSERIITTPQDAHIRVVQGTGATAERKVLNLCANNYLGLAEHPAVCCPAGLARGEAQRVGHR